MNNLSDDDRRQLRRLRFERGHRELSTQGGVPQRQGRFGPSAELWICVVFALLANFVSRAFGWLRVFAYLTFLLSVILCVQGALISMCGMWSWTTSPCPA